MADDLTDAERFVRDILKKSWLEASDIDGGWLQDEAAKRGFIEAVAYDPEKHGLIDDVEPGEECYILAPRLKGVA